MKLSKTKLEHMGADRTKSWKMQDFGTVVPLVYCLSPVL